MIIRIRHDVFMATMILTLGISSIAANTSQSQTTDSVPARNEELMDRLKVLNTIEAQQKNKKELLFNEIDSAAVKLKTMAENKKADGKLIDENRWLIKQLDSRKAVPKKKDSLVLLLPRIEVYTIETRQPPRPTVTPEVVNERVKKKTWLQRAFKFL